MTNREIIEELSELQLVLLTNQINHLSSLRGKHKKNYEELIITLWGFEEPLLF